MLPNHSLSEKNFYELIRLIVLTFLLTLLIFSLGRLAMILAYGNIREISSQFQYFSNDMLYGVRIDLKTTAIVLSPFVLLTLFFNVLNAGIQQYFLASMRVYTCSYIILCMLITLVNFYYFGFYGNYIDVFIFQFLEPENMAEVSRTLLSDYKIILLLGAFCLVGYCFSKAFFSRSGKTADHIVSNAIGTNRVVVSILLVVAVALLARGSITARPLSKHRAALSPNIFFNQLMSNGVMALYRAKNQFTDDNNDYLIIPEDQLIADYNRYYPDHQLTGSPTSGDFQITTQLDEVRPYPNVVLSVMESFGTRLLTAQSENNDLYGSLKQHAEEDYFFQNFTSEGNSTVPSLEKLLLGHALNKNISTSPYRNNYFAGSAASVFKKKGYKTIYITSGKKSWSDLDALFLKQDFDAVYDEYYILDNVAGAKKARTWGVYDEYSYQLIQQILKESTEQPVFIVLLTVTNHSPFEPPAHYIPEPIVIPDDVDFNPLTDTRSASQILTTYQYANNSLGDFIGNIKSDAILANNTIIAATGDHYLRYLLTYPNEEIAWKYKVPFYLYLPDSYKQDTVKDLQRFGSHRDIFPTIYNRVFNNVKYYNFGVDLLAETKNRPLAFSFNEEFVMNENGAIYTDPVTSANKYFIWKDAMLDEMIAIEDLDDGLTQLLALKNAYINIRRNYTLRQLSEPLK